MYVSRMYYNPVHCYMYVGSPTYSVCNKLIMKNSRVADEMNPSYG